MWQAAEECREPRRGRVDYPRPKTAIERRCPLWLETVKAIRQALEQRPVHKKREHEQLLFITKYGLPWAKDTTDNPVSQEFRKLINSIDATATKKAEKRGAKVPATIYRPGLGFYTLRHTFETVAGGSRDQVAVDHIMGHADSSMAGIYREEIGDERLHAVVNHVHAWLFGDDTQESGDPRILQGLYTNSKAR